MSEKILDNLSENGPLEQHRTSAHSDLLIYDVFINVEGLRVRVPRPLFGFIPFGVSKQFGFYVVMKFAAPGSSEPGLLLSLARSALASEFAPVSKSSPDEWQLRQINCRELGAAAPMFQQPDCVDQDWGALWYEIGDEAAKQSRYELAKKRLWDEDFKVPRAS